MNDDDISPVSGRSQSFGEGMVNHPCASPYLQAEGARFMSSVPKSYVPTGSASGTAADQNDETMGGRLPLQNGSASDTWAVKRFMGDI
jgi:hypothetical protein